VTFHVNVTARARRDIEEVVEVFAVSAPLSVARWQDRIWSAMSQLAFTPTRYALAAEADDLGIELRELIFGKRSGAYRILFTVTGQTVRIMHVRRASRGPLTLDDLS